MILEKILVFKITQTVKETLERKGQDINPRFGTLGVTFYSTEGSTLTTTFPAALDVMIRSYALSTSSKE